MNNLNKSSKFGKSLLVLLSAVVLLNATSASAMGNTVTHQDIVSLTNQDRVSSGITPLQENFDLDAAAMAKAQNMLADNYFDHYSPTGATPWGFMLAAGYDYHFAGENLAMDFDTSNGVNTAWLNSPKHAKNIYNPKYTNIGVAVVNGTLEGHNTILVVQMFGAKQTSVVDDFNFPIIQTVSNLLGIGR